MLELIHTLISKSEKNNSFIPFSHRIKYSISSNFSCNIKTKSINLYEMSAQDSSCYLECVLFLELEKKKYNQSELITIFCHFPYIQDQILREFFERNETLISVMTIQFQMKILEQLLLFGSNYCASKIIVFTDESQNDNFKIYKNFITSKSQFKFLQNEGDLVIPVDNETIQQWQTFMDMIDNSLKKLLWHKQKNNPIIRKYLKYNS